MIARRTSPTTPLQLHQTLNRSLTRYGDSSKAQPFFDIKNVLDQMVGGKNDGVGDKTVFVPLDRTDHLSLARRRLVVMDNTYTALKLQGGERSRTQNPKGQRSRQLTANAMAMSLSVTVSMGELMKGVLRTTLRVMRLSVDVSLAAKSIFPGRRRKSLYVSPPWMRESMSSATESPSERS